MNKIKILFLSTVVLFGLGNLNAQTLVPANNATNVSVDMQFKLTFSATPVLQSSGKVRLYEINGTLVSTIDLAQMPSGVPMSDTWPWTETLNGATIRVFRAVVDDKTAIFSFPINTMSYGKSYYVTVDQSVFSNASALGFGGISANNWKFTIKSAAPTVDRDYTVDASGSGDFATLQGALDYVPNGNTTATRIFVKNGTYVAFAFKKNINNIKVEGESVDGVQIKGFNNSNLNASTHWRSTVNFGGNDWTIMNMTFTNTTPNGGTQAEAIVFGGDRCMMLNCKFYSYQDTQLLSGKVYLKDCFIEGDVDFVWGTGTVFFQSCELRANDNGGYNVMARNDNTRHGYCFADCKLTRKSSATTTQYLARDAGASYPYAEVVYLNCNMDVHIPAVGWQIGTAIDGSVAFFGEYQSKNMSGTLINTSSRHAKSRQMTSSQNTQYRNLDWYFNGWTPVVPSYGTKDCAGVAGGTAYVDNCNTCVAGNTGKVACTQDCKGLWGGTTKMDNCGVCLVDNTIKSCTGSMEAELACSVDGITLEDKNLGFKGDGYVNADNAIGAGASWVLKSTSAQTATISFRYANGGTTNRDGQVIVNGKVVATLLLPATGDWTTWKVASVNLALQSGFNNLTLRALSTDGLANIDQVIFSSGVSDANCVVTGLNSSHQIHLNVYPNPTQNSVNWNSNQDWVLMNLQGKTLQTGRGESLDLSGFSSGVYLFKIDGAVIRLVKD